MKTKYNQEVLRRLEECRKTQAKRLNLRDANLSEIPEEVSRFVWLEDLDLSKNRIKSLERLSSLVNLTELSLSNNQLQEIGPLSNLVNLTELFLSNNQLQEIEPLSSLVNLKFLWFDNNQVQEIGPLSSLVNLTSLDLSNNQLQEIGSLSNLVNLTELQLFNNQVQEIRPLSSLVNLTSLDLANNQLQEIEPLSNLVNLTGLRLANNQVQEIGSLSNLVNLTSLDLANNQLQEIEPIKHFFEKGISFEWGKYEFENGIYLKNNPLPPALIEAIQEGDEAVRQYFNRKKDQLFEARVLILGEPRAGKTTLRGKLKDPTVPMPSENGSTPGMEIEVETYGCELEKNGSRHAMCYHVWDFGGQHPYRLLHQFFISEESAYVIVVDTDRSKNEEEVDFWLETIERLGRDREGNYGPVLLLQNPKTNREGSDFDKLKTRYPFWKQGEQFLINLNEIDETDGLNFKKEQLERFGHFKKVLENGFGQLKTVGQEWPVEWAVVRQKLADRRAGNWVGIEEYRKTCRETDIPDRSEQDRLLRTLHRIGDVVHYQAERLKNMVILNKEWLTGALYRVFDDPILVKNKGWFRPEDAEKIWHEEKYLDLATTICDLMEQFRLSYFNKRGRKHVVPFKLPESHPKAWDTGQNVRLHLRYDWLPRPLATQFLVAMHESLVELDGNEDWIWQGGAVFDGKNQPMPDARDAQMKIEENKDKDQIEISAHGRASEYLIRLAMQKWAEVHEPYQYKVGVQKIIVCSCEKCATATRPFEFEYDEVLDARAANDTLKCNKSRLQFTAANILKGIFSEETVIVDAAERRGAVIPEDIKRLIANGEIDEALEKLPNDRPFLNLKSRWRTLSDEHRRGILSPDEIIIQRNRIIDGLVDVFENSRRGEHFFDRGRRIGFDDFEDNFGEKQSVFHVHGGQVNISYGSGNQFKYSPAMQKAGVSKADFTALKTQVAALNKSNLNLLKAMVEAMPEPKNEAEKQSLGQKIGNWFNNNAEGVAVNVTASVYYDVLKGFFGL